MKSIVKFAKEFREKFIYLDVLVYNAANFDHSLKDPVLTEEGFEVIFATNYLGPFLMTQTLMPHCQT